MAQTSLPYGLKRYSTTDSNYSNLIPFPLASGTQPNICQGDPVSYLANGSSISTYTNSSGIPTIVPVPANGQVSNGQPILGVAVEFIYTTAAQQKFDAKSWPGGTQTWSMSPKGNNNLLNNQPAKILVDTHSSNIYKIQANNLPGAGLPQNVAGVMAFFMYKSFNFYLPNSNTYPIPPANQISSNQQSQYALDASVAVDAGPLTVIGVVENLANTISSPWLDPYPDLLVILNNTLIPQ